MSYENGAFKHNLGLGRAGIPAGARYVDDPDWVRRWTYYAEVLATASGIANGTDRAAIYQQLGRTDLRMHQHLVDIRGDEVSRGEVVYAAIQRAVSDVEERLAYPKFEDKGAAWEAASLWYHHINSPKNEVFEDWEAQRKEVLGDDYAPVSDFQTRARDRMWKGGLDKPDSFYVAPADGLRALTTALDGELRNYWRSSAPRPDYPDTPFSELFQLIPQDLAEKVQKSASALTLHEQQVREAGYTDSGIDEFGRTELLRRTLQQLRSRLAGNQSMLILGPTSSGKSHIAKIAIAHNASKTARARCIILLPTKALVSQVVKEWADFLKGTDYEEDWRVLPGSRDFPQFDEALRRGDFKIAVMIPEKLLGLMSSGMQLTGVGLVVADELQQIVDEQRGKKLQRLLSAIRENEPSIPILGLSASLSRETVQHVKTWLRIEDDAVIEAEHRPVPLTLAAFDDTRTISRSFKVQTVSDTRHDLKGRIDTWHNSTSVQKFYQRNGYLREYDLPLALALQILQESMDDSATGLPASNKQILVFAGNRDSVEDLAEIAQLQLSLATKQSFMDADPYRGRFSPLSPDETQRRINEFQSLPRTKLRNSVHAALRSGIGYHSARLEPAMREIMEDAFRQGYVRLLFATDTLKLGLNLPADVVIIAQMTTPENGQKRLLDSDSVIQKMGRAGRLMLGNSGTSYLAVPAKVTEDTVIDEATEIGLAQQLPSRSEEDRRARAARAAANIQAVHDYYLSVPNWREQGARYSPHNSVDTDWIGEYLLQDSALRSTDRSLEELVSRANKLYAGTLDAVAGSEAIDAEVLVKNLIARRLIGPSPRAKDLYSLTGLGRAVSTNGLPVSDSETIQSMAEATKQGAGPLTMLWLATTSKFVQEANTWIGLRRNQAESLQRKAEDRVMTMARQIARGKSPDDLSAAIGAGVKAAELHALLFETKINDYYEQGDGDLHTDILRACVLFQWTQGRPFHEIEDLIEDRLSVTYVNRGVTAQSSMPLHVADLRALGENASYLLGAASELLAIRPEGTEYRTIQALAQAVEVGLPAGLVDVARLNLRITHRERLVTLVDHLDERFDEPADLVDKYLVDQEMLINPSDEQRHEVRSKFLTQDEALAIRQELSVQKRKRRQYANTLSSRWRDVSVPGGETFGKTIDELEIAIEVGDPTSTKAVFKKVLEACGLTFIDSGSPDSFALRSRLDPTTSIRVLSETAEVTCQRLIDVGGTADVLVASDGMSSGAYSAVWREEPRPMVIEPALLFELLIRVLLKIKRDTTVKDGGEGGQYQQVGHLFLTLLGHAQPMFTRSDLENRIAGLDLAEPPSLTFSIPSIRTDGSQE